MLNQIYKYSLKTYKNYTEEKFRRDKSRDMQLKFTANGNRMYDMYFKKTTGMSWSEIYAEHSLNFRPTLEHLKKHPFNCSDIKDPLQAHEAYMEYLNKTYKLKSFEKFRNFITADQINLFQRPYSQRARQAFYAAIEPRYPLKMLKLGLYQKTLANIGDPSQSIYHASDLYHNNPQAIGEIFEAQKCVTMKSHVDLDVAVELMANHLSEVPNSQLDVLTYYTATYEQFAVITLEPYMIFVLGNALFFKIFVPFHKEGGCHTFITKCVDRQKAIRNSFHKKFLSWSTTMIEHSKPLYPMIHPVLQSYTGQGGMATFTVGAAGFIYSKLRPQQQIAAAPADSTVARTLANNLLENGQGLNNSVIESIIETAGRAAYDFGKSMGSLTKSFAQGWLSQHEGLIRDTAQNIDTELTRRNQPKKED